MHAGAAGAETGYAIVRSLSAGTQPDLQTCIQLVHDNQEAVAVGTTSEQHGGQLLRGERLSAGSQGPRKCSG